MGGPANPHEASAQVTVVAGSGRSGTSACAEVLSLCGVRMERTLHRAGNLNPRGLFEDARLVDLNRSLLERLSPHPWLPPRDDVRADELRDLTGQISDHIESGLAEGSPWGFKDPRISWLIPIYSRIFNHLRVMPRYVLCVRDPASAVRSLIDSTAMSQEMAELYWFSRNLAVLRDTGANAFVCHYERLQEDPAAVAAALSGFVFGQSPPSSPPEADLREAVAPALDRASLKPVSVTSARARRLYDLLRTMDGVAFDRDAVTAEVVALEETQSCYQPWLNVAAMRVRQLTAKVEQLEAAPKEAGSAQRDGGEGVGRRGVASALSAAAAAIEAVEREGGSMAAAFRAAGLDPGDAPPDALAKILDHVGRASEEAATVRVRLAELSESESEAERRLIRETARAEAAVRAAASREAELRRLRAETAEADRTGRERQSEVEKALRAEIGELLRSKRFRMGSAIAEAFRNPGLKTLTMPARVVRIALSRSDGPVTRS